MRNRLVVAASRAKRAVIFVGNAEWLTTRTRDMLQRSDPRLARWDLFTEHMRDERLVDSLLPLRCPRHLNNPPLYLSSEPLGPLRRSDCFSYSDSSRPLRCPSKCDSIMECGLHPCQVGRCHPARGFEEAHKSASCKMIVEFNCEALGHANRRKCCDPEPECEKIVPFWFMPCKHEGHRKCCVPVHAMECIKTVRMVFADCKHVGTRRCCDSPESQKCTKPCERKLACGHPCPLRCFEDCSKAAANCKPCAEKRRIEEQEKRMQLEEAIKSAKTQAKAGARFHRERGGFFRKRLDSRDPSYMEACRIVHQNQQPDHRNPIVVVGVEQVYNAACQVAFFECQQDMKDPTPAPLYKFHGTDKAGVDGICENGFRQPDATKPNMDKKSGGTKLPMCVLAIFNQTPPNHGSDLCAVLAFSGTATVFILPLTRPRVRKWITLAAAIRFWCARRS